MTTRETSFREKTIRESNHPGNDRIPFVIHLESLGTAEMFLCCAVIRVSLFC